MAEGEGPFLWLSEGAPPAGFRRVPPGGMCLSAFLFVRRGEALLLGRYAEHPAWQELTGLDPGRVRTHGTGWTLPATHLRYGEDPRAAARRIAAEVLRLPALRLGEPRVETDHASWERPSGKGWHYDVWFLFEAEVPQGLEPAPPPWYAALEFMDPRALPDAAWARGHDDVWRHWDAMR